MDNQESHKLKQPSKGLGTIAATINKLNRAVGTIGLVLIPAVALIVTYEVIVRKLGRPTTWASEVSGYLTTAGAFLALGFVEQSRGHVNVEFFVNFLPLRWRVALDLLGTLLALSLCIVVLWFGVGLATKSYQLGTVSFTELRMPVFILQSLVPAGMLLLSLQYILRVATDILELMSADGAADAPNLYDS